MRKLIRLFGTLMIGAGVLTLGWAALVWKWQDPLSAAYTHVEQSRLASSYDRTLHSYRSRPHPRALTGIRREVAVEAREYRRGLHTGSFTYRAARHYVVAANDTRVLVSHGSEILRLQACHPRFFATERYIVDAKLVSIEPRGRAAFSVSRLAAGATAAGS